MRGGGERNDDDDREAPRPAVKERVNIGSPQFGPFSPKERAKHSKELASPSLGDSYGIVSSLGH